MPPVYDLALVQNIIASYQTLLGQPLVPAELAPLRAAEWLYSEADFAVLAHDAGQVPRFVYANLAAQRSFEMPWAELVGMPSHLSAELENRAERAAILGHVAAFGYATGYRGIRVAKSGRRFWIERGTLWNVVDSAGARVGQAALFRSTRPLDALH